MHMYRHKVLNNAELIKACIKLKLFIDLRPCFCCVRPFYEQAVSDLDRSMHRSLWIWVAHTSFIGGLHTTKNTASGPNEIRFPIH